MERREITINAKDCSFCRGVGCEECRCTGKFSYVEETGPADDERVRTTPSDRTI